MQQDLVINDWLTVPRGELRFTFARSSGPGGQNVNKLNTKAILRWNVRETGALPEIIRLRLIDQCRNRLNDAGELVLSSDRHRVQGRNVGDCLERLRSLLLVATRPPKHRVATKRPRGANEARLRQKKANARKKSNRRKRPEDE